MGKSNETDHTLCSKPPRRLYVHSCCGVFFSILCSCLACISRQPVRQLDHIPWLFFRARILFITSISPCNLQHKPDHCSFSYFARRKVRDERDTHFLIIRLTFGQLVVIFAVFWFQNRSVLLSECTFSTSGTFFFSDR